MSIGKLPIRHIDVDMSRAHPCFVVDLLGDLCPQPVLQYATQHEGALKKCMQAMGPTCLEVKPLYNVPFFADDSWKLQFWKKQDEIVMKDPYHKKFMEYVKGCQEARTLILKGFPWFMDVAKSTCSLKKKGNEKGLRSVTYFKRLKMKELGDAKKYCTLHRVNSLFITHFHGYEMDAISHDELVQKIFASACKGDINNLGNAD